MKRQTLNHIGIILVYLCFEMIAIAFAWNNFITIPKERTKARNTIVYVIDKFGEPKYEDLDFYEEDIELIGAADIILSTEGDTLSLVIFAGNKAVSLDFMLSESSSLMVSIWDVMITYVDYEEKIYVSLDYYHEDEWPFHEDYGDETLLIRYSELLAMVEVIRIRDIELILIELGYDVE